MAAPILRDYQTEAVNAAFDAWKRDIRRPVLVLATGAGKTVIFSDLIRQWRGPRGIELNTESRPYGARALVLAHRDELIDQAIEKLRAVLPFGTRVGKVKAGSNGVGADVVVGSVQTLSRANRLEQLMRSQGRYGAIGLVISDECHLAGSPKGAAAPSGWMKILDRFAGQGSRLLGVTATLARGDGKGLGDVWDKAVYLLGTRDLIDRGHLAPIEARQVAFDVDLSGVRTRGGDYVESDLGAALLEADIRKAVTDAYLEHAADKRGIVFTPTVATAEEAARGLNGAGIRCAVVSGDTPRPERRRIYQEFETGAIQVLANCQVLTTGFDAPWAEVAVLARHTKSKPLFQQMAGRVLRVHPGKEKALLLDLTGSSDEHRLTPLVDLRRIEPKDPGEECPHTPCETCGKCDVCDPCAQCEDCVAAGDCGSCVPCASRERRSCDGCGRCRQEVRDLSVAFARENKTIDLFEELSEASAYQWQTTPKGVRFLVTEGGMIFLWKSGKDDQGYPLYDVGMAAPGRKWERFPEELGLPLKKAMTAAQRHARSTGDTAFFQKRSGWRNKLPSERQRQDARRLGVNPDAFTTAGELSSAIYAARAARTFDPYVRD